MPARATALLLHDGDSASVRDDGALDVVAVPVVAAAHPSRVVAAVVDAVRTAGHPRWLLVADTEQAGVAVEVVAEVLSGRAHVVGLAGLVLAGDDHAADAASDPRLVGLPILVAGPDRLLDGAALLWRERAGLGPTVPADFAAMLASDRVSARTRGIHARRSLADDPAYAPVALDAARLAVLRVVADRVLPQDDPDARTHLDLAARLDAQLSAGVGDGWRHADLPGDLEAYRAALDELADLGARPTHDQDAVLREVAAGRHATRGSLSPDQLALWFEDATADLVRLWVAHPATMARLGYDGVANGGDGDFPGFVRLGAGEREAWEPRMPVPAGGPVPAAAAGVGQ